MIIMEDKKTSNDDIQYNELLDILNDNPEFSKIVVVFDTENFAIKGKDLVTKEYGYSAHITHKSTKYILMIYL